MFACLPFQRCVRTQRNQSAFHLSQIIPVYSQKYPHGWPPAIKIKVLVWHAEEKERFRNQRIEKRLPIMHAC